MSKLISKWSLIKEGPLSAEENMMRDALALERAESLESPLLRLYDWKTPSFTYGHFVEPSDFLNLKGVHACGLDSARRPTGGGVVFHLWDLSFSALIPAHSPHFSQNTLHNYAFINQAVLEAISTYLGKTQTLELSPVPPAPWDAPSSRFCMAHPTQYDVMWQGKKIGGAAQRKTKAGFLHQGTIALLMPARDILDQVLLPGTQVHAAMRAHTHPLLGASASEAQLQNAKEELFTLLATSLNKEMTFE